MRNKIIIQHIYDNTPGVKLFDLTGQHHADYARQRGFYYKQVIGDPAPQLDKKLGSWGKVELIRQAMNEGFEFEDGLMSFEYIVWLDADTLIADVNEDLYHACVIGKIGACWHRIPQLNHWNVGALYIHNCPETREFVNRWLAEYPPRDGWLEQGIFNRLGRETNTVVTVSDKWNATIDVNMVPDAVVLGFHGQGNPEYRYNMMDAAMQRLFPKKTVRVPEMAEVV